jgi:addiction module HigA family antidote
MGIRMQDLASTDFSDVIARPRKRLTVTHPGQFLLDEFMEPHGLSANALATALHVPANRVTAILKGQRAVTADTALRLGRYFGTTPELWLNLQKDYELRAARATSEDEIASLIEPLAA